MSPDRVSPSAPAWGAKTDIAEQTLNARGRPYKHLISLARRGWTGLSSDGVQQEPRPAARAEVARKFLSELLTHKELRLLVGRALLVV